jgi:hypothetical protein
MGSNAASHAGETHAASSLIRPAIRCVRLKSRFQSTELLPPQLSVRTDRRCRQGSATTDGWFGHQVAVHADGSWVAAAAKRRAALAEEVGTVYVYRRRAEGAAGAWESETAWALVQTIEPATGEDRDAFGYVF